MDSNTPLLPVEAWQGPKVRLVLGKSAYGPIAEFDPAVAERAKPVAYIRLASGQGGTGFLVAPDLLLTNSHVFPTKAIAASAQVWFNYENDAAGNPLPVEQYGCDPDDFFCNSPYADTGLTPDTLDYTLVRVNRLLGAGAGPSVPGAAWGYLPILGYNPDTDRDSQITIIQHPQQQPMMVGQGTKQIEFQDDLKLQYVTSTDGGSSGSPVFNEFWHVIALHHAGVKLPASFGGGFGNEGVSITAIREDLKKKLPKLKLPTK